MANNTTVSVLESLSVTVYAADPIRTAWANYLIGKGTYGTYRALAGSSAYADTLSGMIFPSSGVTDWDGFIKNINWRKWYYNGSPMPFQMGDQMGPNTGYFFDALISQYSVSKEENLINAYLGYVKSFIRNGLDQVGGALALNVGEFSHHVFANFAQIIAITPATDRPAMAEKLSAVADTFLESYSSGLWGRGMYWASGVTALNQAVWLYQAILKFAYAFGESDPAWSTVTTKVGDALAGVIDRNFATDGGSVERNAAYMGLTLGQLGQLKACFLATGANTIPTWLAELDQDLGANAAFMSAISSPWGEAPSLGGTHWAPATADNLATPPTAHLTQTSQALPFSSQYVLRSDMTTTSSYLLLTGNGPAMGHHDNGVNQIQLAAGGKRLLVNGGYDLYVPATKNKTDYFDPDSTWKTNTILVDGQPQLFSYKEENKAAPDPARWATTTRFTYAESTFSGGYGSAAEKIADVTHQRKVVFDAAHNVFIVIDVLKGGAHTYDQVWKLAPAVSDNSGTQTSGFTDQQYTVDSERHIVLTTATYAGAENLEIRQFGSNISYQSYYGSGDSQFGWYNSSKSGQYSPAIDIHAEIASPGPTVVISVLSPYSGTQSPITGAVETSSGVTLTFADNSQLFIAASVDPGMLSAGDMTRMMADLLIVSKNSRNETATLVTGDPAYRSSSYIEEGGSTTLIASPDGFAWTQDANGDYTGELFRAAGSATGWSDVPTDSSIANGTNNADTLVAQPRGSTLNGGGGNDRLTGSDAADILIGGAGNDRISGGGGSDWIVSGAGADVIDGGSGIDTVDYSQEVRSGQATPVRVNLDERPVVWGGSTPAIQTTANRATDSFGNTDELYGIENVIGIGNAANSINGSSVANRIVGGQFADDLRGLGGNDTLIGNAGSDTLSGGDNDDVLVGGAGADVLDGGAGNDTVDYSQEIRATASSAVWVNLDVAPIRWSATRQGAPGRAVDSFGDADLLSNIENVTGIGNASNYINGSSVANRLIGGQFADDLRGLGGNDTLIGLWGDDTLDGGANDDWLDGGVGADALSGGSGNDTLVGGAGNDTLDGGAGNDALDGGDGNDSLWGGTTAWNDTLNGGAGNDTLDGGEGNDALDGGDGNDRLLGGAGAWSDTLTGGDGNDTLDGGDGDDTLDGGADDDYLRGGAGNDTVNGGAGDDTLVGGAGADVLDGGDGIDTVDYSADPCTKDSFGDRQVIVNLSGNTIQALGFNVGAGYARDNFGGGPVEFLSNIENVIGVTGRTNYLVGSGGANMLVGGTQADTILGGAGDDTLEGGAGADILSGEGGDDSLTGGAGDDTLNGGDGNDTVDYSNESGNGPSPLLVNLDTRRVAWTNSLRLEGARAIDSFGTKDVLAGIENVIGSATRMNYVNGSSAANSLIGGSLADDLRGGGGDDTLNGGAGNDTLNGGNGIDTVDYRQANSTQSVKVNLDAAAVMIGGIALAARQGSDANGGIDTLTAIENVIGAVDQANYINGSSDANTITGGSKNDYLRGGAGNDTVNGGAGDDTLVGGAGADVLNGGDGIDTVDYSADPFTSDSYGDRQVIVNLSGKTIQALGLNVGAGYARDNFGGGPADYLTNIENVVGVTGRTNYLVGSDGANILVGGTQADTILGGLGNDTLLGNAGADNLSGEGGNDSLIGGDGHDTLNGGDGNDSLQGGSGNDMLIGGAGNDKFIYADGVTGSDIIADFTAGDVLVFSSSIFSNVNDLKAHMREVNGNTVITLDQTSMITLSNTLLITNWKEANFQII